MRRNLRRLTLVLLFLCIFYILIKHQNTVYSVSRLTDHFSIFLPISSKYRSIINTHAANSQSIPSQLVHAKTSQNDQTTRIETRTKSKSDRGHASHGTLPNLRATTKINVPPVKSKKQAATLSIRNISARVRNGNEEGRSTSGNTSGVRVIIVAYGRSGSSFFGGIFNAHPDFFYIYEPLNSLQRIVRRYSEEYMDRAEYEVNAVLNCNFENDGFLKIMSLAGLHRGSSRPLVSPPFCNTSYEKAANFIENQNWGLCGNGTLSADALNAVCRKHANIVTKILLEGIEPADLSWILHVSGSYPVLPSASPRPRSTVREHDEIMVKPVYVLYLVRDPRAMLYSRHVLGWIVPSEHNKFALESGEMDDKVKKVCDTIELNLGAVLRYPRRIKLVRYEELATNPERLIRKIFRELRISPSKEVFKWIHRKTHAPVERSVYSLSRNVHVSLNGWRKKIPDKLLEIIETRCERIMKYLGYLPSNGSQGTLHDLRKPLYLNEIGDLKKSYKWPLM